MDSSLIKSVVFPKKMGGEIKINLTPRGTREFKKSERTFRIEQAKIALQNKRGCAGLVWYDWLFSS